MNRFRFPDLKSKPATKFKKDLYKEGKRKGKNEERRKKKEGR